MKKIYFAFLAIFLAAIACEKPHHVDMQIPNLADSLSGTYRVTSIVIETNSQGFVTIYDTSLGTISKHSSSSVTFNYIFLRTCEHISVDISGILFKSVNNFGCDTLAFPTDLYLFHRGDSLSYQYDCIPVGSLHSSFIWGIAKKIH